MGTMRLKMQHTLFQYLLGEVLCHTDVDLDGRCATVRQRECNLGNLITNAMLEATHAHVALLNSGLYEIA